MALISPTPKLQFFANNGTPLAGGKVYTYAAGTSTPQASYTDYTGDTPNSNPVILDSRGEASIWLSAALGYKFTVTTSNDTLVYTTDNINGDLAPSDFTAASLVGYTPAGAGAVVTNVQTKLREFVSVKDFGATGDGSTDDTAAIQLAINYAITSKRSLRFPTGNYRITDTLLFSQADGITISGEGSGFNGPTRITAGVSMPTKALMLFSDCRNIALRDFSTACSAANNIKCALEFTNGGGSTVTATHYLLENLYLYSTSQATGQTNGVLFSLGAGGDNNNDFGQFVKVIISNADNAAVKIEHGQSREHRFYGCYFQTSVYGIDTNGFSFYWYGGNMSEHTGSDFYVRREQQSCVILGISSEQSKRLFETSGSTSADSYVTIMGTRFAADLLNADGRVIIYQHRGALVLEGNVFGTRTDTNLCKLLVGPPSGKGCSLISQGNTWGGAGSLSATPYQVSLSKGDKVVINDSYVDSSTVVDVKTTLPNGATTPSIFASNFFQTANTAPTTIIDFQNAWPGKQTVIYFADANTSVDFANISKLRGNNGVLFTGAVGDSLVCTFDGTVHLCTIILG